jgi:predicted transcriptional regulator
MPKKKLSDIVFQRVSPPDEKDNLNMEDLAHVLVKRLGLKRKESRAQHARLLLELMRHKKDSIPLTIEKISQVLTVSQSQTYEEIRKWRTLGLIEFVKIPAGEGFVKGYMLTGNTVNRLLDRAESATKSFFRKTRRIAKDFDDLLMLEMARSGKPIKDDTKEEDAKQVSESDNEGLEEN